MGKSTRATGADGAGHKQKTGAVRDDGRQTNRLIVVSIPFSE